jgi:hypothetical protein
MILINGQKTIYTYFTNFLPILILGCAAGAGGDGVMSRAPDTSCTRSVCARNLPTKG